MKLWIFFPLTCRCFHPKKRRHYFRLFFSRMSQSKGDQSKFDSRLQTSLQRYDSVEQQLSQMSKTDQEYYKVKYPIIQ